MDRRPPRDEEYRPLLERLYLELDPPSLRDNTADLDRLVKGLRRRGIDPVDVHPSSIGPLRERILQGDFKVTAVLARTGPKWELVDVLPGREEGPLWGLALDLGTSRLAFYLLDLRAGEVAETASVPNPQIPWGEDILARILHARREDLRRELGEMLARAVNRTAGEMVRRRGGSLDRVYAFSVAGNTTMTHFFLGLDPSRICREPYIPVANRFPFFHARDLALDLHPRAPVYVFPNVGSYFGGDLVAGILATGMQRREEVSMLVDVGTNAEVVLGNRDWLLACAGAAGPALEGGVVERGMMAAPGAVDRVRVDPETLELSYRVLGGGKPRGLCGSGLIDLVAELFAAGVLTVQGRIDLRAPTDRVRETPDGPAFLVAPAEETADGRDLLVSQIDIGILLKSKAAMYTILSVITRKVGMEIRDVSRIFVAGTFGNRIDPAMAVRMGMLPDLPLETYQGMGNTAGEGAVMILRDRSLLEDVQRICDRITYVELNVNMELMNEFRGALFLPHTDPGLFPSVAVPRRALGKED